MDIRKLTDEEWDQQYPIWSQAFENGDREMNGWKESDKHNAVRQATYGIWDEAGLQAAFLLVDMHLHFGPNLLMPMGAINGVAVLPAARGKNYAKTGMRYVFERMRENGQWVSLLEPFNWDFYRTLGYDWIGPKRRYSLPSRILKPSEETQHVRAFVAADRAAILDVYARFAGQYRGMLRRTEYEWNQILDDTPKQHTFTFLYERDGQAEGYLTYRGGKREETKLREFLCLSQRAQSGLLGLLRRHSMQTDQFAWDAPDDDLLWSHLYHWRLETKTSNFIMGRIVDVAGALQAWKPMDAVDADFVLEVEDEHAPWNAGRWRVTARNSQITVTSSAAMPDIHIDIQALSQVYFGSPSAAYLRRAERITIYNERAGKQFEGLLAGPPMWINDSF